MAYNVYGTAATLRMRRSMFDRNYSHKTSEPFGKLVPIGMPQEVLPGDLWSLKLSNVKRMLTPKAPIMDDISADIYGFYVPNRIIWSKAKNFFGENDQVAWTLPEDITIPHLTILCSNIDGVWTSDKTKFYNSGGADEAYLYLVEVENTGTEGDPVWTPTKVLDSIFSGTLFEYFGLPFVWPSLDLLNTLQDQYEDGDFSFSINALPFRAYQMVYNEFFRNENITDPILSLNYDGSDVTLDMYDLWLCRNYLFFRDELTTVPSAATLRQFRLFWLQSVARWKDLFTSCLPAPQRGPSVGLPLLGEAPVHAGSKTISGSLMTSGLAFNLANPAGVPDADTNGYLLGVSALGNGVGVQVDAPLPSTSGYIPKNLWADLSAVSMATVNEIRLAFATQRYYEKLARGGARYNEYLQVMFGVRPSDAVLQRPQYLGGKHIHINISQVIATANSEDADGDVQSLGQTGAYSATGFKDHIFSNSFTEHGVLCVFVCNRKEHSYCQGLDKFWTKRDVFDLYNPTFAHIGEVPVMKNEVYWQPGNTSVLGYNEAWYEYRSQASKVTGLLNPMHPNALGYYVLTDVFESAPSLTDDFIFEDAGGLDRALVATADVTDQFISDYYFQYKLARVMPTRSIPGLIDHF